MSRIVSARLAPALLAVVLVALVGCAGSVTDGAGTSEAASTAVPAADPRGPAITAGNYDGHQGGLWDGSLAITNASPEGFDFEFDISPDRSIARGGQVAGRAKLKDGNYRYDDGSCTIDFDHVTDARGAQHGDLFVNASLSCAIDLDIDGHTTGATALDFTSTWVRW